jgi:membrane-associated phospholipid phosphatase
LRNIRLATLFQEYMPHDRAITLSPTAADVTTARAIAEHATPAVERTLRIVTWLADEKLLLAAAIGASIYCRTARSGVATQRCADQVLWNAVLSAALPHLLKRFVDRERPDRRVVRGRRHGIPRSGNRYDSFPSGHALHLGALASALTRTGPPRLRPFIWPATIGLASTRFLLLAHYVSDVVAGLVLGVATDRAIATFFARRPSRRK